MFILASSRGVISTFGGIAKEDPAALDRAYMPCLSTSLKCIYALSTAGPTLNIRIARLRVDASETKPAPIEFLLYTNKGVMVLLAELLSNQHAFIAGVSK